MDLLLLFKGQFAVLDTKNMTENEYYSLRVQRTAQQEDEVFESEKKAPIASPRVTLMKRKQESNMGK